MPSDRHFRNAWTLNGKVISEDIDEAKKIFKDKIREVRKPLLEAQDVLYMKAMEDGDSSEQSTIATKKKELRDAPAASAITNATTITTCTEQHPTQQAIQIPFISKIPPIERLKTPQ